MNALAEFQPRSRRPRKQASLGSQAVPLAPSQLEANHVGAKSTGPDEGSLHAPTREQVARARPIGLARRPVPPA